MKQSRREAREAAFCLLFEWSFRQEESMESLIEGAQGREPAAGGFASELCTKAVQSVQELDRLITDYSDKWKINRISKVSLAALRLAFCEITGFDDIPPGASVNEAVELVKSFGTEDDAAYVNGILGAYLRSGDAPKA
ncbi:MAG: transcription antitermination factor NusB [Oscillospiraceae bacterium]|nr:transcription antitermination factor NusB [Oscillospiraceae bacterium]